MKMIVAALSVCLLATGCGKSKSDSSDKTGGDKKGNANKGKADWPLDEFKGKNPVMVVVTGESTNPRYQKFFQEQWRPVASQAEKHNLVIMEVFFNRDNQTGRTRPGRQLTLREARNVYDAYQLGPTSLSVTLIGKDGKQIKKFKNPKTPQEVLDLLN